MSTPAEFRVDLSKIKAKIQGKMRQLVQGTARTLYNEMSSGGRYSPGTPVGNPTLWKHPAPPDYVPGFARGSWSANIGGPAGEGPGNAGAADAGVEAVIAEFSPDQTLYVENHAPYIRRLEFDGHSSQALDGFVRPAAEAIELIVAEVVDHLKVA